MPLRCKCCLVKISSRILYGLYHNDSTQKSGSLLPKKMCCEWKKTKAVVYKLNWLKKIQIKLVSKLNRIFFWKNSIINNEPPLWMRYSPVNKLMHSWSIRIHVYTIALHISHWDMFDSNSLNDSISMWFK